MSKEENSVNSLAEALQDEITRARRILGYYQEIMKENPIVVITVTMIENDIRAAIKALAEGDVIACLQSYEALKGLKE